MDGVFRFCDLCKRKNMITRMTKCKCEKLFCFRCRYPEDHKCSFDYHKDYKQKAETTMVKVESKKLDKI